jgi:AcrR family transcriptional regulator
VTPRRYESTVRADAAQATRDRIVRAAVDLAYERGDLEMTLEQIAARADTTVRTVMRQFGSRDAVIEAGTELASAEVAAERHDPGGDRERSIRLLVEHYEKRGAFVLRLLASELPSAQRVTATGRLMHRAWVEEVFATDLPADPAARDETVDLLVVATDVYAWKLLRLDRGLDEATTTDRIRGLTRRILEGRVR